MKKSSTVEPRQTVGLDVGEAPTMSRYEPW